MALTLVLYYAGRNDHGIGAVERYPGPRLWPAGRLNFLRHWALFKRVQLRFLLLPIIDVDGWVTWSNGWARSYRESLTAMQRDTIQAGGRFLSVTQIMKSMSEPITFGTEGWHELLRQSDALAIQRDVVGEEGMVDVRHAFRNEDQDALFFDVVHLTPRGNDVLARALADGLRDGDFVP